MKPYLKQRLIVGAIIAAVLIPIMLISETCNGQNGRLSGDTLFLESGNYFIKNDLINIGAGSKADGGYAYIQTVPDVKDKNIFLPLPLSAGWNGYKMKIIDFKLSGTEIMGKKYYLLLTVDDKSVSRYICDPELALKYKEIL